MPPKRSETTQQTTRLLGQLITLFRARMDDELKSSHITLAQLRVLREIHANPGGTGASLARACGITPQSAQAMVVRAVARGWAARTETADNRRLLAVQLTTAGARLLDRANEIKLRMEAELWAGVPIAQIQALNATLGCALRNLESVQ